MSNQSKISENLSHAYFTSETDANYVISLLDNLKWIDEDTRILEPSCGAGALAKPLINRGLEVTCGDLIDYGFDKTIVGDFFESSYGKFDIVLTNPPFGKMANLAVPFFNHSTKNADKICFIVPQSFRKISIIDRLDERYWPILDSDLPSQLYNLPDGSQRVVKTCVQMWERRNNNRPKMGHINYKDFFTPVTKEKAIVSEGAFAIRGQGSKAGEILDGLNHSPSSTRFLIGSRDKLEQMDLSVIAGFTAGIPSIGYAEMAHAISLYGTDKLNDFLTKGALALL